jgi:hypothetical protein
MFLKDMEEKGRRCRESNSLVVDVKQLFEQDGLDVQIASAGSSNIYILTGTYPGITDVLCQR